MADLILRPSPGATGDFAPKKLRRPARAALRRYTCPCGCGRTGWFSQPRTLRAAAVSTHPDADAGPA
jgi:hypothetical protein